MADVQIYTIIVTINNTLETTDYEF